MQSSASLLTESQSLEGLGKEDFNVNEILQADTSEGQQIGFAPSLFGESTLRHPDMSLQAGLARLQQDLRMEVKRNNWQSKLYSKSNLAHNYPSVCNQHVKPIAH